MLRLMESGEDYRSRGCIPATACLVLSLITACGSVTSVGNVDDPASSNSSNELDSSTLIPGIVVDPARGNVYIMRPAGGIAAVDVDTGRVHWTSEHAEQVLFVASDVLLARLGSTAPSLLVMALEPDSGQPAPDATPQLLPLPSGAVAGIDDTLERTFRHSVKEFDDGIYLSWEFVQRDVTGFAPPGGSGYLRRETGAFRYAGNTFETAQPPPASPAMEHWPLELRELFESKRILRQPWKTTELLAIAQQVYGPDQLVLRRWRQHDAEPLADKTLFDGRALAALAACDEQYVAVSVPSGRPALEPQYLLRYYALDSGALVAEVNSRRSVGPFCVLDSRLLSVSRPATLREQGKLVEHPLELVATDLASGKEIWRRALRDTAFRGTAPPRH